MDKIGGLPADVVHRVMEKESKMNELNFVQTAQTAEQALELGGRLARLVRALAPLVAIADAYDRNELDDEARKWHGPCEPGEAETREEARVYNQRPPEVIELYQGRGGRQLLTLADCLEAREAYRALNLSKVAR